MSYSFLNNSKSLINVFISQDTYIILFGFICSRYLHVWLSRPFLGGSTITTSKSVNSSILFSTLSQIKLMLFRLFNNTLFLAFSIFDLL